MRFSEWHNPKSGTTNSAKELFVPNAVTVPFFEWHNVG